MIEIELLPITRSQIENYFSLPGSVKPYIRKIQEITIYCYKLASTKQIQIRKYSIFCQIQFVNKLIKKMKKFRKIQEKENIL